MILNKSIMKKYTKIKLLFTFTSSFRFQCLTGWNILESFSFRFPDLLGLEVQDHLMPVKNHAAACSALCWCQHKQNWKLLVLNTIFQVWVLFRSVFKQVNALHGGMGETAAAPSTQLEAGLLLWAVAQRESCRGWPWRSMGSLRRTSLSDPVLQHLQSPQQCHTTAHCYSCSHQTLPVLLNITPST